jgi:hypothetical protein
MGKASSSSFADICLALIDPKFRRVSDSTGLAPRLPKIGGILQVSTAPMRPLSGGTPQRHKAMSAKEALEALPATPSCAVIACARPSGPLTGACDGSGLDSRRVSRGTGAGGSSVSFALFWIRKMSGGGSKVLRAWFCASVRSCRCGRHGECRGGVRRVDGLLEGCSGNEAT